MVHAVWGTKNHEHFFKKEIKQMVIAHILQNAKSKSIYIDRLNGHAEHLHCLLGLNADMSISKCMNLIKGESAFWINREKIISSKFAWGDEYYAVSVSDGSLDNVRKYIDMQEEHHRTVSFQQEVEKFLKEYYSRGQG